MNDLLKSTARFAVGTCVTLCAVTVAASVAAGSHLGKIVAAGFKGAKGAIEEELAVQKEKSKSNEHAVACINVDTEASLVETKASTEDIENSQNANISQSY